MSIRPPPSPFRCFSRPSVAYSPLWACLAKLRLQQLGAKTAQSFSAHIVLCVAEARSRSTCSDSEIAETRPRQSSSLRVMARALIPLSFDICWSLLLKSSACLPSLPPWEKSV